LSNGTFPFYTTKQKLLLKISESAPFKNNLSKLEEGEEGAA
jgi:hypothetical protein